MNTKAIILFDGVCNLCNGAVKFIIKRDKKKYFQFISLQSQKAKNLLAGFDFSAKDYNSFVLIENDKIYSRSAAALKICTRLKGLWPLLYSLMIVPKFIRDGIYNFIARHRYKWFGTSQQCEIPAPELEAKFLN